jgi:hypothetical protein
LLVKQRLWVSVLKILKYSLDSQKKKSTTCRGFPTGIFYIMLFNSIEFLVFFPIVTIGYFLLPHKFRWLWLLIASCYFYMAFVPIYGYFGLYHYR